MLLDAAGIPNISEGILTVRSILDGSLSESGMHPFRAGDILARYGIPTEPILHANISDLEAKLEAGHGVLVVVDADEISSYDAKTGEYKDDDASASDRGVGDNHILWLKRIDRTGAEPVAIINDSGDPRGAEREIPLHVFMDAFADSGGYAVVTTEPLNIDASASASD